MEEEPSREEPIQQLHQRLLAFHKAIRNIRKVISLQQKESFDFGDEQSGKLEARLQIERKKAKRYCSLLSEQLAASFCASSSPQQHGKLNQLRNDFDRLKQRYEKLEASLPQQHSSRSSSSSLKTKSSPMPSVRLLGAVCLEESLLENYDPVPPQREESTARREEEKQKQLQHKVEEKQNLLEEHNYKAKGKEKGELHRDLRHRKREKKTRKKGEAVDVVVEGELWIDDEDKHGGQQIQAQVQSRSQKETKPRSQGIPNDDGEEEEEVDASLELMEEELTQLLGLFREFNDLVQQQQPYFDQIEEQALHVEAETASAVSELAQASSRYTLSLPMVGAAVGALVGGPVGAIAGAQGLTALGVCMVSGMSVGAWAGNKVTKKQQQEALNLQQQATAAKHSQSSS
ncbi:hypothetical protein QOT17_011590 [Balamuthia mandrillaris]